MVPQQRVHDLWTVGETIGGVTSEELLFASSFSEHVVGPVSHDGRLLTLAIWSRNSFLDFQRNGKLQLEWQNDTIEWQVKLGSIWWTSHLTDDSLSEIQNRTRNRRVDRGSSVRINWRNVRSVKWKHLFRVRRIVSERQFEIFDLSTYRNVSFSRAPFFIGHFQWLLYVQG